MGRIGTYLGTLVDEVTREEYHIYMKDYRDEKGRFIKGSRPAPKTEFKKGHSTWNKGMKFSDEWRRKLSESHKGQVAWNKGKHVQSNDALKKWREAGNKPANWQEENPTYAAIHQWLIKNYGRPELCEHCGRTEAKRFEWAKLRDKAYERKRENFIRLCKKCHNDYDGVNAWQQK